MPEHVLAAPAVEPKVERTPACSRAVEQPGVGWSVAAVLELQKGVGNVAVARMLARGPRVRATLLLRDNGDAGASTVAPPASADAGAGGAGADGRAPDSGKTVALESYTVAKFPDDQRTQAE